MDRRRLLASAASGVAALAGCLDRPGTGDVDGSDTRTPGPCARAFDGGVGGSADCGATFHVSTSPLSDATTDAGETPYEGTFDDYLTVTVAAESAGALELRGCVRGRFEGRDHERAVSRTLPAGTDQHDIAVGPFTHPGGVHSYHLWLAGCEADARGPT